MKKRILSVVGARPNFMKVAPLHRALERSEEFESLIVHTGQHYDEKMSDIFFRQLGMPEPDEYLGIGSGSHAEQTARVMVAFEEVVLRLKPDLVIVVGDVNSTVACSLVAAKLHIPVAHVEAGLRSGDRTMPEEINRLVTDSISDYLFVTEQSGIDNLQKEGVEDSIVHFVGNLMIDSLVDAQDKASGVDIKPYLKKPDEPFVLVTMHRPGNVDNVDGFSEIVRTLEKIAASGYQIVFPIHPRTRKRLSEFGLSERVESLDALSMVEPLGYLEFLACMMNATAVVTDSGGIQEETTYLGVPCITVRPNTERPVTIHLGTNVLSELDADFISDQVAQVAAGEWKEGTIPPYWDGATADRIVGVLEGIMVGVV